MSNQLSLFLVFGVALLSSSSFAEPRQTLKCRVEKNVNQILSVEVEETDLEGQIAARILFSKKDGASEPILRVSNGSVSDFRIYLYETNEFGVGTTYRYLERNRKDGTYSISHYFQCDWVNHEEKCPPGADLEFRGSAGDAVCEIVNH
ncbi:MAG: hypothetical protein KGP28_01110 [Bdellovibrionales bacterium]|nr:hypothetical protein [Bdellovibrionales bacterium]